jgi:hypothetical protein
VYSPFLILSLVLGAIGYGIRGKSQKIGQVCMGLSVAGCIGLTVWRSIDTLGTSGIQRTHRGQAAVAYTLAHQYLSDKSARTGEIILIFPPNKEAPTAALDSFYEGYARVMARFRTIQLKEVAMDISAADMNAGRMDAEAFGKILSDHPNALAFVSWVGFPEQTNTISPLLTSDHPPVYIYNPSIRTDWSDTLKLEAVKAIAIEKPPSDTTEPKPQAMTPPEVFAQTYELITKK